MTWRKGTHGQPAGFTLLELITTISIVGILSSIALVNLSPSWTKNRLLATTRDLENWLSEQRSYAKSHSITCLITIDEANKRLISRKYSGQSSQPCTGSTSNSEADVFDLAANFGSDSDKLSLISTPSKDPDNSDSGILFSLQGFSQNHQLDLTPDSSLDSRGVLELRLVHTDLQQQRCIRIISPIGMIRDGRKDGDDPQCRYDKTS